LSDESQSAEARRQFMKRDVALRYAELIHRRLKSVNGLLATPLCNFEAVRFRRVWIFGSTVKGSQEPNDLDVLIESYVAGRRRSWQQGTFDKIWKRRHGLMFAKFAGAEAFKWLTAGMRKVSPHSFGIDMHVAYPRVMIYPRFDILKNGEFRHVVVQTEPKPAEVITIDEIVERNLRRRTAGAGTSNSPGA
jgi:hypothetical protein